MSGSGPTSFVTITEGVVSNHNVRRSVVRGDGLSVAIHTLVGHLPVGQVGTDVILSLLLAADALVVVSPCNIFVRRVVVRLIVSEGSSSELEITC